MGIMKFDEGHMDGITKKYNKCAELIDDIIFNAKKVLVSFENAYDGQAKETIIPEAINKIIEHLELLKMCYSNIGVYVTDTKCNMMQLDNIYSTVMNYFDKEE